jgi:hypothetical protein
MAVGLQSSVNDTIEDRIEWINEVTELAVAADWRAVEKAIGEIDYAQARLLLQVLIIARAGDLRKLRALGEAPGALLD